LTSFRLSFQSKNMGKRGLKNILDGLPGKGKHHKQKYEGNPDISKSWKRGSRKSPIEVRAIGVSAFKTKNKDNLSLSSLRINPEKRG